MKITARETMMVPQLKEDGSFLFIQVNKGTTYQALLNDCGPVVITTSGIIMSKKKVLTNA